MSTQTTLTVWIDALYTDISGQLRRLEFGDGFHGYREDFDGLLLKRDTRMGSWLQNELVKSKHFELGNERDSASVLVSRSGIECEPWKLEWHFEPRDYDRVFYSMSTLPLSNREDTVDLPKFPESFP
ncbi:MAG: hypothetical protein ASARMPREDX12_003425 [Alectoria sarmentosa]|nr:MAG: hypothetical protein ASARMPREDX12_003425 [Alectoria sarmentosa]CAD6588753.1 MAG: hypothetical protein ASARMPRED_003715 [Alectoria sarmentosa]